jgi:RecA-family ATPase
VDINQEMVRGQLEFMAARAEAERILRQEESAKNFHTVVGFTRSELSRQPMPPWIIEDMWREGQMPLLFAEAKAGKTTFSHNLVKALANGTDFLGYKTQKCPNIWYLDCELTSGELRNWLEKLNMPDNVKFFEYLGYEDSLNIAIPEVYKEMFEYLNDEYETPDIIVLDTVGAVLQMSGIDENSNTHVGQFLRTWQRFGKEIGAKGVLTVHHTGNVSGTVLKKGDRILPLRPRGASAFRQVPNTLWSYAMSETGTGRVFNAQGRNGTISDLPIGFDRETNSIEVVSIEEEVQQAMDRLHFDMPVN